MNGISKSRVLNVRVPKQNDKNLIFLYHHSEIISKHSICLQDAKKTRYFFAKSLHYATIYSFISNFGLSLTFFTNAWLFG